MMSRAPRPIPGADLALRATPPAIDQAALVDKIRGWLKPYYLLGPEKWDPDKIGRSIDAYVAEDPALQALQGYRASVIVAMTPTPSISVFFVQPHPMERMAEIIRRSNRAAR